MNLKKEFNKLKISNYKDTQGVVCIDSGIPGPVLGVLIMTHGNEPCGIYAYKIISNNINLLKKGKILFILQNIKASDNYFNKVYSPVDNRFYKLNLNRLPLKTDKNDSRYELIRANELKNIYKECDVLIDLHSTSQVSEPMALIFSKNDMYFFENSNFIKNIVVNLDRIQIGRPILSLAPKKTIKIGVECGSHKDIKTYKNALNTVLDTGSYLDMFIKNKQSRSIRKNFFMAFKSLILKPDYKVIKRFANFKKINKGEVIAISGNKKKVFASDDLFSLFCPKDYKNIPAGEEAMFLLKKINF